MGTSPLSVDVFVTPIQSVEDLVAGMMELHGLRDNPHTLWISARAAMANRS